MGKGFPATIIALEPGMFPKVECDETPDYGRSGWYHPDLVQSLLQRYKNRREELSIELAEVKRWLSIHE